MIEQLQQIPDARKKRGKRHTLWLILVLVLLGTLCGDRGYRPLADCSQLHWHKLCELLELPLETGRPSDSTLRRVWLRVEFEPFADLFNSWRQWVKPIDT